MSFSINERGYQIQLRIKIESRMSIQDFRNRYIGSSLNNMTINMFALHLYLAGLRILAFPCNQFNGQAPEGDGDELVCSLKKDNYDIGDLFAKVRLTVNINIIRIHIRILIPDFQCHSSNYLQFYNFA